MIGIPASTSRDADEATSLQVDFPTRSTVRQGHIHWPNQALEPIYMWNNTGTFVPGWGGQTYSNNTGKSGS